MTKSYQIPVRIDADVHDRIERLLQKLGPMATRAAVVRWALIEGIAAIERHGLAKIAERWRSFHEAAGDKPRKRRGS